MKHINVQDFTCSHLVKLLFAWDRNLCFIIQSNQIHFEKGLAEHFEKYHFVKFFTKTFHVTTISLSNFVFIFIPYSSKETGGFNNTSFIITYYTTRYANQTFLINRKAVVRAIYVF